MVKNLPASAGDVGHTGLIPGGRRSPGGGNSNPLPYSCPGNPMDRGAWCAAVHGVTKELDITEATKQHVGQDMFKSLKYIGTELPLWFSS